MYSSKQVSLGELLKLHRQRAKVHLTQKELAGLVGVSSRAVRDWESEISYPTTANLKKLIEVFVQHGLFNSAQDREEAELLWNLRRERESVSTFPPFDQHWFEELKAILQNQPVNTTRLQSRLPPHNLPTQLTSFIGRKKEIAELKKLVTQDEVRLVTLVGVGGGGKTRLALQLGGQLLTEFAHGVWLVELASLFEASLLPQRLAAQLGLKETTEKPVLTALLDYLHPRQTLLVLDNCEHLVTQVAHLAETLLKACPQLTIIATSREGLGIKGEWQYLLAPLALPQPQEPVTRVVEAEAVQLLVERARAVQPNFAFNEHNARAVVQICQTLDGLPLALELAATRLKVLTPEQIATRLEERFKLLSGGSHTEAARQQSLKASIEWSYDLLSEPEKLLFRRMAVFAGGCTLEAVEGVCGEPPLAANQILDLLTQLVNKSLVLAEEPAQTPGQMRYRMLETLREYGLEKLREQAEDEPARHHHLAFYLALAERAERHFLGAQQGRWLERLEQEHDNFRVALRWALSHREGEGEKEVEQALRLGGALCEFWRLRGHWAEGQQWFEEALAQPHSQVAKPVRAKALYGSAILLTQDGFYGSAILAITKSNLGQAEQRFKESEALYRELGDKSKLAHCLLGRCNLAHFRKEFGPARLLLEECLALFREAGDKYGLADTLQQLGQLLQDQGNLKEEMAVFKESLVLGRELEDKEIISRALRYLGWVAYCQGDVAQARACYSEAKELYQQPGNSFGSGRIDCCINLGMIALYQQDYSTAQALFEQSLALSQEADNKMMIVRSLLNLGRVALLDQRNYTRATSLFKESLRLVQEFDYHPYRRQRRILENLEGLAGVKAELGRAEQAAQLFGAAEVLREECSLPVPEPERPLYEQMVAKARAHLNETSFGEAWAKGRATSLEEIIAESLTSTDISQVR